MTPVLNKRDTQFDLPSLLESQPSSLIFRKSNDESREPKKRSWDRSMLRTNGTKRLRRTILSSSESSPTAGPKDLKLVKAAEAGVRAHECVTIKHESPWKTYNKVFELKLEEYVIVAVRKDPSCEIVFIKSFNGPDADVKIKMLQRVRHHNFIAFLDAFTFNQTCYAIFEHEHIIVSLAQFVSSPAYPTELHLAAVLGQVKLLTTFNQQADLDRFLMVLPILRQEVLSMAL